MSDWFLKFITWKVGFIAIVAICGIAALAHYSVSITSDGFKFEPALVVVNNSP